MPRKVKFTEEESVRADTRKKQEILRNTKINEQRNRDIQTAQDVFSNPNLSDQQKRDTVSGLESGFKGVERLDQLPRIIENPAISAADMFQAKQESKVEIIDGKKVLTREPGQEDQQQAIEELGTQPLIGELQEKIDQPPELQGTIAGRKEEIVSGQKEFLGRLFTGKASSEEITKEAKNFAIGLGITSAAVAGAILATPFIASQALRTVITSKVGVSVTALSGSLGVYFIGGKITDLDRGEIQTSKRIISGMVEEGERIEADVRNGLDPSFAIERLSQMAEEISNAESEVKLASIYNVKYRFDGEAAADQQDIIKAREAIRRRLRAVENIAITGTAALDIEALIQSIGQR